MKKDKKIEGYDSLKVAKSKFAIIFFSIAVVALLVVCVYMIIMQVNVKRNMVETEAVITRMVKVVEEDDDTTSVSYDVYVDYEVDGVAYQDVKLNSYHIGMKVGETVKISYDKNNPGKITGTYVPMVIAILSFVIMVVFIVVIIRMIEKRREIIEHYKKELERIQKLLAKGNKRVGKIVNIRSTDLVVVNGVSKYKMAIVRYEEDLGKEVGQKGMYSPDLKSGAFTNLTTDLIGSAVDVYFDDNPYLGYYIDVKNARRPHL